MLMTLSTRAMNGTIPVSSATSPMRRSVRVPRNYTAVLIGGYLLRFVLTFSLGLVGLARRGA